ncbi:Antiseptic resistance protein (plasmid) [Tsukamurella tyrosinosolvens]|uniref:Drug resistance transporter, EmrB/QacA subfamily n=2 Tax=Tsukamurella TaxID=2060 RepID=A0A1H1BDT1_9ACTN|nr:MULTISPECIES: MFS transporter [Tsukamurella]SDQ50128.1 drug resistance transporter, EmrB/QacA subfamily [Tsukamurella pulmonis]SED54857.1 drug resistance transporter, EmrB/QacA subfamily [Tsukamurella tyrosinosolvens]SUP25288.1 Antiseptic resistance protein [Tsukamurella pulmonis]VEI01661.1 Antiseptic resistance protein [Tsukamurella tyrosinosolvens]
MSEHTHLSAELPPIRRWAGLAALVIALLTVGLDLMVLNVALPTLAQDLGASTTQLQWIVNAYTLVFAALMLPAGGFGDRYGRKRLLLFGLVAFVSASAWAAYSGTTGALIAARAVMGVGAAIIVPLSLGILPILFPPDQRRRAIAVWVGALGIGLPLGPIVGGWLLQHFWWGSVFLINVPVGVAALIACIALLPESSDPDAPPLDWPGIVTAVTGTAALVFGVIQAPDDGWTHPVVLTTLGTGVVLIAGFLVWERRASHPLIDLRLFSNPGFTWPTLAATAGTFTLVGVLFVLPQYLQILRHHDALGTGLRLVPLVLAILVAAAAVDSIVTRIGAKIPIVAGLFITAMGFVLASRITADSEYGFIAACLAVVGLGAGLALAPAVDAVMATLPEHRSAAGSGLLMAIRQIGAAFSVAILGTLLNLTYGRDLDPHLTGLPAPVAAAAREGIAAAQLIAADLPGPAGDDLAAASAHAYTAAMSAVFLASAVVSALLAALIALRLPARRENPAIAEGSCVFVNSLPNSKKNSAWDVLSRRFCRHHEPTRRPRSLGKG